MQYRFEWTISTENYQDIVCATEQDFDSHATANTFGLKLLKSIDSEVIKVYSWGQEPVWFIR